MERELELEYDNALLTIRCRRPIMLRVHELDFARVKGVKKPNEKLFTTDEDERMRSECLEWVWIKSDVLILGYFHTIHTNPLKSVALFCIQRDKLRSKKWKCEY